MKRLVSILVAGLVGLAFSSDALAQGQSPPHTQAPTPGPGIASGKMASQPAKRKAKRVRKHRRAKRASKPAPATKAQ